MDRKIESHEVELKRPAEAMRDLEPDELETEQVKGGFLVGTSESVDSESADHKQ
jgi:hypothetical protein